MKIYLAGSLFDLRHLAGNVMLARAIEKVSGGQFSVYLPQDYEPASLDAKSIRDGDFLGLLDCDVAIFQFDGTELDSGTVAEFMAAKFADMPAVLLRTDFRNGGDRNEEPWNLMCSFYPRTESLVVDGIGLYVKSGDTETAFAGLAASLIEKLNRVSATAPVSDEPKAKRVERLVALFGLERS